MLDNDSEIGVSDFFGRFNGDGIFPEFTEDRINRLASVSGLANWANELG